MKFLEAGCTFAKYGTRRGRDYQTQIMVLRRLIKANEMGERNRLRGIISGTSNVRLAQTFGLQLKGTFGHEWFMVNDYKSFPTLALGYWLDCFGDNIWKAAPTDTFGSPIFLESFRKPK